MLRLTLVTNVNTATLTQLKFSLTNDPGVTAVALYQGATWKGSVTSFTADRLGARVFPHADKRLAPAQNASVLPLPFQLYGWRTHAGREVDFLLTHGEDIVAVEVKAARRVTAYDLAGFAACRELFGPRVRRSVLLYPDTEAVALNADTVALPFATFFGIS